MQKIRFNFFQKVSVSRTRLVVFLFFVLYSQVPFCSPALKASHYWQSPVESKASQNISSIKSPDILTNLNAKNCGICHPDHYKFWQDSLHAKAIGDGLLGQLYAFDKNTQKDCLSCHAPRQEQINKILSPSNNPVSSGGVDCAVCHVRKNIRHGTREIAQTPHGLVRGLPLFKESGFCKSCHQFDESGEVVNGKPLENTYVEWQASPQAKQGKTCQHCHMPNKEHRFKGIHDAEMTRQGLSIKVSRNNNGINLKLGNTGAGHALPTYITPRIVAVITSSSGKVLQYSIQRKMQWDEISGWKELSDTRLLPHQWKTLFLKLDASEKATITVRVEPDADYHDRVYPDLLRLLDNDLHASQKKQLQNARKKAGESIYTLYVFECQPWEKNEAECFSVRPN